MKNNRIIIFFIFSFIFFHANAQFVETFPVDTKGILFGPCFGDYTTCGGGSGYDFTGVDWVIGGVLTGIDSEGFKTASGALGTADVDEEACYISQVINISMGGSVSVNVDLTWVTLDASGPDYIDVEYRVDFGSWVQIPNQFGSGTHTVNPPGEDWSGSGTVSFPGITGNALEIRVCGDHNSGGESFTIDNVSVPQAGVTLPVTWAGVHVEQQKGLNIIEWSTAEEINNDRFEIQRSLNKDLVFETVGTMESDRTSADYHEYSFEDHSIDPAQLTSFTYYRIKQIDLDGTISFSKIVFVFNDIRKVEKIVAYPNPFTDKVVLEGLSFLSLTDTHFVDVYNGQGVLVEQISIDLDLEELSIDLSKLTTGIYTLHYMGNEISRMIKL